MQSVSVERSLAPGWAFTPVLAPLLARRRVALLLIGVAAFQVGLGMVGITGWRCPVRMVLGIPCPGCGLTTAMVLLLRGEWRAALSTHLFAPLFLAGFVLALAITLLPDRLHREAVLRLAAVERRTGVVTLTLIALVVYWVVRLMFGLL